MEVGVNKLLSFIKAGDKRKVSSAAHKTHICYATTQVYLGHLQRNLIINNEWACPCFRVGSFNLDHTFTGRKLYHIYCSGAPSVHKPILCGALFMNVRSCDVTVSCPIFQNDCLHCTMFSLMITEINS